VAQKPRIREAWHPAEYALPDAYAVQALAEGRASAEQQGRAFKWIVEHACSTYDLSFRPQSQRDTDFAEGRRFVGLQLVKLSKMNLALLKRGPDDA